MGGRQPQAGEVREIYEKESEKGGTPYDEGGEGSVTQPSQERKRKLQGTDSNSHARSNVCSEKGNSRPSDRLDWRSPFLGNSSRRARAEGQ